MNDKPVFLRSLSDSLLLLTLTMAVKRMKLDINERYAIAEVLRDLADATERGETERTKRALLQ